MSIAVHRQSGERFACKQLKLNRATPRYVSKLYHEVSIMRELSHPHTVKLHEVFYAKRQIFLIMELASGGEVFDLLTSQVPGPAARSCRLSEHQAAHSARQQQSRAGAFCALPLPLTHLACTPSQPGDHFSEPFAAELVTQMLSAVHYIHSRGVVHRDLKLENFLLEEKAGPMAVSAPPLRALVPLCAAPRPRRSSAAPLVGRAARRPRPLCPTPPA